jgi:tetratricopeptide (TPR) repeat protein
VSQSLRLAKEANELRKGGRYVEAGRLFEEARATLPSRVVDRDDARVNDLEASWHIDQMHYGKALACLESAGRVYHLHGLHEELARCRLKRAKVHQDLADWDAALDDLHAVLDILEPGHRLRLIAGVNMVSVLVEAGEPVAARATFEILRERAKCDLTPLERRRYFWIEGQLMVSEGRYARAERRLKAIARLFQSRPADQVFVLADLAICHDRAGEPAKLAKVRDQAAAAYRHLGGGADHAHRLILRRLAEREGCGEVVRLMVDAKAQAV